MPAEPGIVTRIITHDLTTRDGRQARTTYTGAPERMAEILARMGYHKYTVAGASFVPSTPTPALNLARRKLQLIDLGRGRK